MKKSNKINQAKDQLALGLKKEIIEQRSLELKREIMVLITKRMKEKDMTRYKLSQITNISQSTLSRYFNFESDFTLINYFKIVLALNLHSYLIPSENDTEEMNELNALYNGYIEKTYYNRD